ncbi:hypothetical protein BT69DRAFT_1005508 [Atractiella rhizophila]|nr:hypothetical protein BT69DRAFT_1005508 [Atractiella rhizophila]
MVSSFIIEYSGSSCKGSEEYSRNTSIECSGYSSRYCFCRGAVARHNWSVCCRNGGRKILATVIESALLMTVRDCSHNDSSESVCNDSTGCCYNQSIRLSCFPFRLNYRGAT